MAVTLGELNNRKAQYMASYIRRELGDKFTYDELYKFTRTVSPRPNAIKFLPEYTNLLKSTTKAELEQYSSLTIGSVCRGHVSAINKEGIRAKHMLICVTPGIDPFGRAVFSSVTSKDYKATTIDENTGDTVMAKGVCCLQRGDIIKLNKSIEDELDIYVGNIVKFKALPGSFSDNYAVKITEIYREEE